MSPRVTLKPPASTQRCTCGAVAQAWHHPTGRDGSGDYFDPLLACPLCRRCHRLVHRDWVAAGLADGGREGIWEERLRWHHAIDDLPQWWGEIA